MSDTPITETNWFDPDPVIQAMNAGRGAKPGIPHDVLRKVGWADDGTDAEGLAYLSSSTLAGIMPEFGEEKNTAFLEALKDMAEGIVHKDNSKQATGFKKLINALTGVVGDEGTASMVADDIRPVMESRATIYEKRARQGGGKGV